LTLEITESAMMRDTEVIAARLRKLREIGIRIAIDDFGTGYSALNYLRQLPVDVVKIDRSFVIGIVADPAQRALVAAIIDLGHVLGLHLVAEGVETEAQRLELEDLGCDLGQGFLWARPLELPTLLTYLEAERADLPTPGRPGHGLHAA
jgi:EAL domain-containing protein (putative c-di-GMP-specific phosphodiesterase class I)